MWEEDGKKQGDARIISALETAIPWLNQAEKVAAPVGNRRGATTPDAEYRTVPRQCTPGARASA